MSSTFPGEQPAAEEAAAAASGARYYSWEVTRRDPKWVQKNTGWGSHRAVYPYVETESLSGHLVRMPGAQRAPWHGFGADRENLFLCVQGEIEFSAAGTVFPLKPYDFLFCRGVPYSYQNPGFQDGLFWVLTKRRQGAAQARATGASASYHEGPPEDDPEARDRMRHVRWDDYRRQFSWGDGAADTWGARVCAYPTLEWLGVQGRLLRVPPAQKCEVRRESEVLYVGISGLMELRFGEETYRLGPLDALGADPGAVHEHVNAGAEDALFWEMTPR